ncbi:MAG: hypothetical protein IKD45_05045 [Clostridia bacterium]|nr:hypothetical protein [Clostridia bacterium]
MKKIVTIIVAVVLVLAAAAMMTSCAQWADQYKLLDKEGSTVSVKFDANGGMFAGANGVTVVDVFNLNDYSEDSDGTKKIPLIAPDDDKRGNNAFEISRTGYNLAGWFVKEAIVNDDGEALDEDGNVASESGKEPAYKLTEWDFSKDKLALDPSKTYTSATPALTLTAVWLEYVNFEFYEKTDKGFDLIGTHKGTQIDVPEWDMSSGKLNYKNFIKLDGKTLTGAYLDEAMTEAMTATVKGEFDYKAEAFKGEFDYELGIWTFPPIKIYTEWMDGEWYKISSAAQLNKNTSLKGCYEILADLDFSEVNWPAAFTNGTFAGTIVGNGHKISGIETTAYITRGGDVSHGAVFGSLAKSAKISGITFDNVTYTVKNAAKASSLALGLLAGTNGGATLTDVKVENSVIKITEDFGENFAANIINESFKLALLFADGDDAGIDSSLISCEIIPNKADVPADFTVSADENGQIVFTYQD